MCQVLNVDPWYMGQAKQLLFLCHPYEVIFQCVKCIKMVLLGTCQATFVFMPVKKRIPIFKHWTYDH